MFLKTYLIALAVFLFIDFIWLAFVAKNFYKEQIGFLLKSNVDWVAVILFYLIFVFALVFFVINPSLDKQSLKFLILSSLLFGLVTYATYDLTNQATIKSWPTLVTVVDLIWGMFISSSTAIITYSIINQL